MLTKRALHICNRSHTQLDLADALQRGLGTCCICLAESSGSVTAVVADACAVDGAVAVAAECVQNFLAVAAVVVAVDFEIEGVAACWGLPDCCAT